MTYPQLSSGTVYPHVVELIEAYRGSGNSVLELGCGGGQYSKIVGDQYCGLDLPQIKYAGRGADIFADAQRLPFRNQSYNLIFTVATLHLVPDVAKVLEECHRTLARGGKLLVFDYNRKTTARLKRGYEQNGLLNTHVWSPKDLAKNLRAAGFQPTIIWDYSPAQTSWKKRLFENKILRFIWFWLSQMQDGWNIVLGEKKISKENKETI